MKKFYVIKIVGTINADSRKWYEGKDWEFYVCVKDVDRDGYRTANRLRDSNGEWFYGHIPEEFSEIITTFNNDLY